MSDSTETRVALMERDLQASTTMISRLEITIEKIGEVAGNVAKILAVHDERLQRSEQNNSELYRLAEQRRDEMQQEIKDVNHTLSTMRAEIAEDMRQQEQRIINAFETRHQEHKDAWNQEDTDFQKHKEVTDKRIRALENWRWMLVGAGIVLGFVLGKVPAVTEMFKASLLQ